MTSIEGMNPTEKRLLDRWIQEIGAVKAVTKLLLMRRLAALNVTPVWKLPENLLDPVDLDEWHMPARNADPAHPLDGVLTPEMKKIVHDIAMRED